MRKRSNSERVVMLPGRVIGPWEVMGMHIMSVGTESLSRNKYLLPVVDKASKFLFAFRFLRSKRRKQHATCYRYARRLESHGSSEVMEEKNSSPVVFNICADG